MANTQTLIAQAYSVFNRRDIDAALALMSENISWPKASEGGRVVGKEEIRAYWNRQWKEFDPHVEPVEIIDREGGITEVKIHQLVKDLVGDVLSDSEVWHVYTIANGLIERMDIKESERARAQPHLQHSSDTRCQDLPSLPEGNAITTEGKFKPTNSQSSLAVPAHEHRSRGAPHP